MIQTTYKVKGAEEFGREMVKLADGLGISINRAVPIAAGVVARRGRDICTPGEKMRDIVSRKMGPRKKDISNRTDTSRTSTHWIVFKRQGKRDFYVPVNPDPKSVHYDDASGGNKDFAAERMKNKRVHKSKPSVYNYQQTRNSTSRVSGLTPTGRRKKHEGKIWKYDSRSEINSMRKIRRRGLAGISWTWMGKQVRGVDKMGSIRVDDKAAGDAKKRNKSLKKWTKVKQTRERDNARVRLENKLTYITNHYGNFEPTLLRAATESMVGEMERQIEKREAIAQKRINKAA